MEFLPNAINKIKDVLLVLAVVYFYGLAIALQFHFATYGLDQPAAFLTMNTVFLLAIGLEITLAWWNKKVFVFWLAIGVLSYGIIGLYVAPSIYGPWILTYVFLEPLIVVFVGGIAFGFGNVLAQHVFSAKRLPSEQVRLSLKELPGWNYADDKLSKTFAFRDFLATLDFLNRIGAIVNETHHHLEFHFSGRQITLVLTTSDAGGVTLTDVDHARKFDVLS
jgi:4a-hydroxytetrahydrobiopterin dehydratase